MLGILLRGADMSAGKKPQRVQPVLTHQLVIELCLSISRWVNLPATWYIFPHRDGSVLSSAKMADKPQQIRQRRFLRSTSASRSGPRAAAKKAEPGWSCIAPPRALIGLERSAW